MIGIVCVGIGVGVDLVVVDVVVVVVDDCGFVILWVGEYVVMVDWFVLCYFYFCDGVIVVLV